MSFGYETQIPPIYTLTFFNAIANRGKMIRPIFVKKINHMDETVQQKETSVVNPRICSNKTLAIIQQMLKDVVLKGTAKNVQSDLIQIAGKTGTAQLSQGASGYKGSGKSHQVSFCGYFPADDPRYSCIVVLRKPRNGPPSGGLMAGSVVKHIAEEINARYFQKDVTQCDPDSTFSARLPLQKGRAEQIRLTLKKLNFQFKDELTTQWAAITHDNQQMTLKDHAMATNTVPDVIGMGAKDAVYLLESSGLKTSLSGKGKVTSQSIVPGESFRKGQAIRITLN